MTLADQIQVFVNEHGLEKVLRAAAVCAEREAQDELQQPGGYTRRMQDIADYIFRQTDGEEL